MGNSNNNVGKNEATGKVCDDIQFDLAPTAGTDTVGTRTGQAYTPAQLLAIAIARGMTFEADASLVDATHSITEIEMDLKPIGGEGYNEGDDNKFATATTADASYVNNGSRTDLDPSGGREDDDSANNVPTSVDSVWVCNGSIATIHLKVCKDAASKDAASEK